MSTPGPKSTNIQWQAGSLTRAERFAALGTRGGTVWFTGLSASGKSTIAAALERRLVLAGRACYRLDGDNLRFGLNRDLGFSVADRAENIRRIGEVARLLADSGCVALAAFISPYRADRDLCRALHEREAGPTGGPDAGPPLPFIEVFVDTPLEVCEARDPKGLYKKARAGQLTGFTGIDDPYEPPLRPDLVLKPASMDVEGCVEAVVQALRVRGLAK